MAIAPKFGASRPKQNIAPPWNSAKLDDRFMARERDQRMRAGQPDEAEQRAMRDAAHAEPADDAGIQQRRDRHRRPRSAQRWSVNHSGALNTSTKTCWAELMKPNSPPTMKAMASM